MDIKNVLSDINSKRKKKVILDTDAYNEIDDQFAITYAMFSEESIDLCAICAAPFHNRRSESYADGMEKSYDEILRVMKLSKKDCSVPVYRGSRDRLASADTAVESEAADKIAEIVLSSNEPVYIVAIGAITNVASAIIKYPQIKDNAVVVWLGGHALHYKDTAEFNLAGDVVAAQVIFDCGIPLVQIPCFGVCTEFHTTIPELRYFLEGKNPLCDYLVNIVREFGKAHGQGDNCWSKVIWDVTAVAVLTMPDAFDTVVIPKPIVTAEKRYAFDPARDHYIYVSRLHRDKIFRDLFEKLTK